MNVANKGLPCPTFEDPRQGQASAEQKCPTEAVFAGRSASSAEPCAVNLQRPPPYSPNEARGSITRPYVAPPDYSVAANFDGALSQLQKAYKTDFGRLAQLLSNYPKTGKPFKSLYHSLLNAIIVRNSPLTTSNDNFRSLTEGLWKFVTTEREMLERESPLECSQLIIVVCMHFLEQQHFTQHNNASTTLPTGDVGGSEESVETESYPLSPAMVRKEFFNKLITATEVAQRFDAERAVEDFIKNNQSGLQADLNCELPLTANLKFSPIRYEDIPGAVISEAHAAPLTAYSNAYSINLSHIVDIIGRTGGSAITSDPLETIMRQLAQKTGNRKLVPDYFFANKTELFRDRNARCLLELMNYCQNQVFSHGQDNNTQSPHSPETGEKCQDARYPVQESSANQQKIRDVRDKFRDLLLPLFSDTKQQQLLASFGGD